MGTHPFRKVLSTKMGNFNKPSGENRIALQQRWLRMAPSIREKTSYLIQEHRGREAVAVAFEDMDTEEGGPAPFPTNFHYGGGETRQSYG